MLAEPLPPVSAPRWWERDSLLPGANRVVRTPGFVLTLAVVATALCGAFLHQRGWALCAGLALVAAVGVAWPWLAIRSVRGALRFERRRGREGEPTAAALEVSRGWTPVFGLAVRGGLDEGDEPLHALARLAGRSASRWNWTPACRGEYPKAPPQLTTAFPFGLKEFARPAECPQPLLVWPATLRLPPLQEPAASRNLEGAAYRDVAGHFEDFTGIRPHRHGEPLRRVHWAQTARHDRLMVVERQSPAAASAALLLDASVAAHAGSGPHGSREWAIRLAASLGEALLNSHMPLTALLAGEPRAFPASRSGLEAFLDALAKLPDDEDAPLAESLRSEPWRRAANGPRFVVASAAALAAARVEPTTRVVALRNAGFGGTASNSPHPNPSPPRGEGLIVWAEIASAAEAPAALRRAWEGFRRGG